MTHSITSATTASLPAAPRTRPSDANLEHARAAHLSLLLASLWMLGCAGNSAFATRFPDNQPGQVQTLLARLEGAPAPAQGTVAVGVSTAPTQLYGFDLSARRVVWRHATEVSHPPMLTATHVVTQEGAQVVGRELTGGHAVFSLPTGGLTLNGAAGDQRYTVITLSGGQGTYAQGRVVLLDGNQVLWQHTLDRQVGVPALAGKTVLVPWSTQYLSGLDLLTGEEIARLRVGDGVVSHALTADGAAIAASQYGFSVIDKPLGTGSFKAGRHLTAPKKELPGRPLFLRDTYAKDPVPSADSAQHRIRLDWSPVVTPDRAGLANGLLFLTFYRFVFAFEEHDLALRWVYTHDSDLVGAHVRGDGLVFADEHGTFGMLSAAAGTPRWTEATGIQSTAVSLPGGAAGALAGDAGKPDPASIRRQLLLAAQDPDARLVPVRLLAVELLADFPQPEVTADLLALCDDHQTAPAVRKHACESLQSRKTGGDHLLAALERRYSYLEGTSAPPVGALARAAAARNDTRAVSALLAHLRDPNTPSEDLPVLVAAAEQLGQKAAVEPLSDFLRLYHADPVDEYVVKALEACVHALAALAGPMALDTLEGIANDPLTVYSLREKAGAAYNRLLAQRRAEEQPQTAEAPEEQPAEAEEEPATAADAMPERMTLAVVSRALLPVRDQLRACLDAGKEKLFRARVVVVVEDGVLQMVSVLPQEIQGCVKPLVQAQTFPRTKFVKRETVTYTVKRR